MTGSSGQTRRQGIERYGTKLNRKKMIRRPALKVGNGRLGRLRREKIIILLCMQEACMYV